jgi:hypothetical protein
MKRNYYVHCNHSWKTLLEWKGFRRIECRKCNWRTVSAYDKDWTPEKHAKFGEMMKRKGIDGIRKTDK